MTAVLPADGLMTETQEPVEHRLRHPLVAVLVPVVVGIGCDRWLDLDLVAWWSGTVVFWTAWYFYRRAVCSPGTIPATSNRRLTAIELCFFFLALMTSRYEPCGLNQLYSLKYGTPPLVHATGGLKDTVTNATEEAITDKSATGFVFYDYDLSSLDATLRWATTLYRERPADWQQIVTTGMQQDWSWHRSASDYGNLYQDVITRVRETINA